MKWKLLTRCQMKDILKSMAIFYCIYYAVILLLSVISIWVNKNYDQPMSMNGYEISGGIFIFIFGLCSFKERFLLCLQSGISRKTMFLSFVLSSLVLAFGMSVVDLLLSNVFRLIFPSLSIYSIFETGYISAFSSKNILFYILQTGFSFVFYLAMITLGYMITTFYYRIGKIAKIIVSISVPVFLIYLLPLIDFSLLDGNITWFLSRVFLFAFGLKSNPPTPWIPLLSLLAASLLFLGISFGMIRKAEVKKAE